MELTTNEVRKLWDQCVRVCGDSTQRSWVEAGGLHFPNRAYLYNVPPYNEPRIIPTGTLIFWPEYPKDFDAHPAAYKTLEVLYYSLKGQHLKLDILPAYRTFFLVTPTQGKRFLNGELNRYSFSERLRKALPR